MKEQKELLQKEIQVFDNVELGLKMRTISNEDGSISVNAEDTAIGFGWAREKNGKIYPKWDRMNGYIKEMGFSPLVGKDDFIPESLFYMLGMKAKNETAMNFQKWLAMDVIPSIRKYGAYISDNEEQVDADYVKFARGNITNTFMECPMENIKELYKQAMGFYSKRENKLDMYTETGKKRKGKKFRSDKKLTEAESKLEVTETIIKALDNRAKQISGSDFAEGLQKTIRYIEDNGKIIKDLIKSGKMSGKTREIKRLKEELEKQNKK